MNGVLVGTGDSWMQTYNFRPKVMVGRDVIAVLGHNLGGPAGFIGVFNGKGTRPDDWRCKRRVRLQESSTVQLVATECMHDLCAAERVHSQWMDPQAWAIFL